MLRITTHPLMIRFTLWLVALLLTATVFLFWGGGFAQLLEYINDVFVLISNIVP